MQEDAANPLSRAARHASMVSAVCLASLALACGRGRGSIDAGRAEGGRADAGEADAAALRRRTPSLDTACRLRTAAGEHLERSARATVIDFHDRGARWDGRESSCEVFTRLTELTAPILGKVVRLDDVAQGTCTSLGIGPRTFALGRGTEDDCGSVVYEGTVSTPRFSAADDPIHGHDSASVQMRLEDHRARSPRCPRQEASMVLREEATINGRSVAHSLRYTTKASSMPRPSPLAPAAICPFFREPDQPAAREPSVCEVGTYFLEDDAPQFGKLVELRDWVDLGCPPASTASATPLGARLYPLGRGTPDNCNSVHYEAAISPSPFFVGYPSGLRWTYVLAMIDHRKRMTSAECPPPSAPVELEERLVYRVFVKRPEEETILDRRFFAPREDAP